MSLNTRQLRFYTDVCDIYNPVDPVSSRVGANGDVRGLHYPATPTYSDQNYFKESGPEVERGKFYGRRNQEDTVSLMDKAHFDQALTIKPGALIYHKTAGPDQYSWYVVSANSTSKVHFANKQAVYIKRTTKGPGIT